MILIKEKDVTRYTGKDFLRTKL